MSGGIGLGGGYGKVVATANETFLAARRVANNDTDMRYITIDPKETTDFSKSLQYIDKVGSIFYQKYLFGEHNKPRGTYVGDGSTETRTINIGGIGSTLRIVGYGCFGFCTSNGSLFMNSSIELVATKDVRYENGILTMATDYHYVNCNGTTYYYEVL